MPPRLAPVTTLYVAADCSDAWSGSLPAPTASGTDGPLATLSAARDRIRAARSAGAPQPPSRVLIRAGTHLLPETFVLEPRDSGSAARPVLYAAYPGERPVLSGGVRITGWRRGDGDIWQTDLPEVKRGRWWFRQLVVGGTRRPRARALDRGFFRIDGPKPPAPFPSWHERAREAAGPFPPAFELRYRGAELRPSWAELGDVEVIALFAWADVRMPLRRVDAAARVATLAARAHPFYTEDDARYWVENAPEALDTRGEWRLDRASGVLSYRPAHDEDPRTLEAVAPRLDRLVHLDGDPRSDRWVRHVVFRGLTFQDAGWDPGADGYATVQAAVEIGAALKLDGAADCAIEQCTITRVEGYALDLGRGSRRNRVVANEIVDVGAGGIKLGWGREGVQPPHTDAGYGGLVGLTEAELNRDNVVSDNHIHRLGRIYPSGAGIWVGQSIGSTFAHNHIHDLSYSAISVGWTWRYLAADCHHNVIEWNHLHHVGNDLLSDLGAIYTLGIQPGTVIRHNLIHDVTAFRYGGWGIYPDQASSYITIEKNVVYRTGSAGLHQHYGRDNVVRNNVFALGAEAQVELSRPEDHVSFTFERNVVYADEGVLFGGDVLGGGESTGECACAEQMPASLPALGPRHARRDCRHLRADHNLYFDARRREPSFGGETFAGWQRRGHDRHSVVADPRFVDPARFDFRLRPDSPALRLGFEPIDLSGVGPRPAALR